MSNSPKNLVILGATGSIGDSTLDIIARHPEKFDLVAISGHKNVDKLTKLCEKFNPGYVVISDESLYLQLAENISNLNIKTKVLAGESELETICTLPEVDMVVAAIVGSAGMKPVLATVKAGKDLLLANKEALVVAGDLVMSAAKKSQSNIIPLDSEHNAIYQCLPDNYSIGETPKSVDKIILTASGGPFWNKPIEEFSHITPEQACAHPNWDMGRKISVDSATLMNKGLEVIEAYWLFNMPINRIDVHVHPQSIIHSLVCFKDGSLLAQLGEPDMRIPISYGLGLGDRLTSGAKTINLLEHGKLNFIEPDYHKFPCLRLARDSIESGGTAMAVLNIANEVVVDAFLNHKIPFTSIAEINQKVLEHVSIEPVSSLEQLLELDIEVRSLTSQLIVN